MNRLLGCCELENAETVFLYYSIGREVSTVSLIERIVQNGRRAALPVSEDNGIMEFYIVDDLSQLQRGRFGIPEPPVTQPVRPEKGDVIIVPALCCDKFGHRLGRGAGYYDRYLAEVKCFSICLCRKVLLEDKQRWRYRWF